MLLVRALAALALLGVGLAGGLAAVLVHAWWWGLVLGLAAGALTTLALPAGGWRLAFVVGWFGAIVYAVLPRAEGDYLLPGSTAGYTVLGGSFLLLLVALATSPRPGTAARGRQCRGSDDPGVSPG
ncbi:hypothetical protein CF8_0845 [Nocardioides sp. CF8]|uniref:hypothetical protein n=1 Tax=Nocardioides sp. CF8 TaxID=110319 RepID=UPI00032D9675|nr:hypothetical protein [Nocardioides sp. CF8]EON25058.1 hypothetical protein CF8_0845 [Nocardioides sp. CF8]